MDEQLDQRARALCAADMNSANLPGRDRAAAIAHYWLMVAAEIAGDDVLPAGYELPADFEERQREYGQLRRLRV